MSLAEKRARADQLRGELSQLRVEKEAAFHDSSSVNAEAQIDAELARLEDEKRQALLELEAARTGGSVDDALAAMQAAEAIENGPQLVIDESQPTTEENVEELPVEAEAPVAPETPAVLAAPALVETETKSGGSE